MKTLLLVLALALVVAGCGGAAAGVSPTTTAPTPTRAAAALLSPTAAIAPVQFPQDEAPHDLLTEWWYYTGHLFTTDGRRYGFELVFFQANRGIFQTAYAAHFAITDNPTGTFHYAQKVGANANQPTSQGFALALQSWSMRGALGHDHLQADMPGYAIDLDAQATKPPALHDGRGYVDLGPAGGSYYYSRTRMTVSGTLTLDGQPVQVTGTAWMDHQWGNFIVVGAGGWDWFAVQLDDNQELMAFVVRDATGAVIAAFGTLDAADGTTTSLEQADIAITATGSWTSPASGATYPSGWTVALPAQQWALTVTPTMQDQELRTNASTGVTYWEGEQQISGTVDGKAVTGWGYVELTGYAGQPPPSAP